MKVARASKADIEAALDLVGVLDCLAKGYYPSLPNVEAGSDEPLFMNEEDPAHLRRVHDCLKVILARPCSPSRAIFGGCTLLDPRNRIIDPDDDVISPHPRLVAAGSLRSAIEAFLAKYIANVASGDWGKWDPEEEDEVKALRAALADQRPPLNDPALQELFSSAIDGAQSFGYQGVSPPPPGHWLTQWWERGRDIKARERTPEPADYRDRVVAEQAEYSTRAEKLRTFIESPTYQALPQEECLRLRKQLGLLLQLDGLLAARIAAFPPKEGAAS